MDQDKANNTSNLLQLQNQLNIRDKFCWECKQECDQSTQIECTKCVRTFHSNCVKSIDENGFVCTICKTMVVERGRFILKKSPLDKLKYVMDKILKTPQYQVFQNLRYLKDDPLYVNPIDLDEISRKIDNHLYDSLYAFQTDIDCIHHKCSIRVNEQKCLLRRHLASAEELRTFCKIECKDIMMCAGCYENKCLHPKLFGQMACDKRHRVLWLEVTPRLKLLLVGEKSTRWPAKVLADFDDCLWVYLFGRSEVVRVPNAVTLPYTGKPISQLWQRESKAMNELIQYVTNVEEKFGHSIVNVPDAPIALPAPKEKRQVWRPQQLHKPTPAKMARILADTTNLQVGTTARNNEQAVDVASQMKKPLAKPKQVTGVVTKAQPKLQDSGKLTAQRLAHFNAIELKQRESTTKVKKTIDQLQVIADLTQAHNEETAKLKQEIDMHASERSKAEKSLQDTIESHAKEIDELKKQQNEQTQRNREEREQIGKMKTRYKGKLAELYKQLHKVMAQNSYLVNKMKEDVDAIKVKKLQMKLEFDSKYAQLVQQIARKKNKCDECSRALEMQRFGNSQGETMMNGAENTLTKSADLNGAANLN